MTACPDELLLAAYLDDELEAADRARVEEHLGRCPACSAELARMRAAGSSLRKFTSVQLTPDQRQKLHEALDASAAEATAEDARMTRTLAALGVLAASVLIVAAAWLRALPPPPHPTSTAQRPGGGIVATWPAKQEAWEEVAVTLRPDPASLPRRFDPAQQFAGVYDADLADWMLEGLRTPP
jgi:anti-sigma factor RsiW